MKTWKIMMVLACGLAILATGSPFDEPGPAVQAHGAMPNGQPAIPPTFSWNDIFKGPR
jgi:hypothetical protein